MSYDPYFLLIFGVFPLVALSMANSSLSLSPDCHGEGCTGEGCIGNHCSGEGCRGDNCAGSGCTGNSCGGVPSGSDTGFSTSLPSRDERLECMISCALCHEKYFGDCGTNSRVSALDKVNSDGIYSAMASSTPQSDTVSKYSYSSNVSKIGDLSYGTLYIIIDNKGRYTNVYDNLNLDPKSHLLSSTIKNNTKVIWINLDRINKHGIELLDTNNGIKLLSSMIPFGGTVEYTFTSLGDYRFFDPQHKEMQRKIIVSSSIDIWHVVSNKLNS